MTLDDAPAEPAAAKRVMPGVRERVEREREAQGLPLHMSSEQERILARLLAITDRDGVA